LLANRSWFPRYWRWWCRIAVEFMLRGLKETFGTF